MARMLIVCSTTDGQTRRICDRLQQIVESSGHEVTLALLDDVGGLDPREFDRVVIGASIRYGKHKPQLAQFVNRHASALQAMPSAFFSVNIVARKPGKNRPDTNPYVRKFLQQITWRPKTLEVFAGKLDYPRYGLLDRLMIQFIMLLTHGPTDPKAVVEFTDWQRVEAFGRTISAAP